MARTTVELAKLPFAFALRDRELLTLEKFLKAMRERGLSLVEQHLEALHRTRILVPMLRVARDPRKLATAARADPSPDAAWFIAPWTPSRPEDFRDELEAGRVFDPALEKFTPWHTYKGNLLGKVEYRKSVFLYAPHQLVALPMVRQILPRLRWWRGKSFGSLDVERRVREAWVAQAARKREIALAASAIEPRYYPGLIGGWVRLRGFDDPPAYHRWEAKLPLQRMLRWLGIDATWLTTAAEELLQRAHLIDPLGPWWEVVAHGEPEKWSKLKGEALSAMDLRVAAESLLRYHDHLAEEGKAKPLPEPSRRWPSPFEYRLKPRRSVDALLTEFGLSPHPRVVLVLEGPTELLLVPRIMRFFKMRIATDFIDVQSAEGADRDLSPLVAYLAPKFNDPESGSYARFERPPSRFLVVFDPEGKVATPELREKRRQDWIDRIMRALPAELKSSAQAPDRTEIVREQIEELVFVETWKPRSPTNFEFAHFTDLELAEVIHGLDSRTKRNPSVATLRRAIGKVRAKGGSLDKILDDAGIVKPAHADPLWPKLERRIVRAYASGDARRIPVVRVLARAQRLAYEYPRNVVMGLERQPQARRRKR